MFSWDPAKARLNARKHGVSFEEAVAAFGDPRALDGPDARHSIAERRRLLIGTASTGRIVTIAYTRRTVNEAQTTRLISARPASARERAAYEGSADSRD